MAFFELSEWNTGFPVAVILVAGCLCIIQYLYQYIQKHACFVWPGPLITQIFVVAPPSTEKFLLQLENCVPGYEKSEGKQEEDSDSDDEDAEEEKASGKR